MAFDGRDRAFLRKLTFESFFYFVKIVGGYTKNGADASEFIHRPLCNFAQDRTILKKLILTPRNWRKSTIFTKLRAVWEYLHNPEIRILIVSENALLASRFASFIQDQVLSNPMLRWLYPELTQLDKGWTRQHKWNSTQSVFPRTGMYSEATLTIIGLSGAAQSGHYDLILIDDLVGKAALESPIVLDKVKSWFDNVDELLVQPGRSEISCVGTYWFPGDFASYASEDYHYQTKIVPALKYTGKETIDTPTMQWIQNPSAEEWDTNFPEALTDDGKQLFSKAYYVEMMNNPEKQLVFWTQHMNMPGKPSNLTKFDQTWLRYCYIEEREE